MTTWSAELPFGDILGMNFVRSIDRRPVIFLLINVGNSDCLNALQILATFTNGSLTQLPNQIAMQRSGLREVNKRIRQAMEIRSSERMRNEHITAFTQVFKDSHMEGKVRTSCQGWAGWGRALLLKRPSGL